ncbi:MAG: hypothetical protein ABF876_11700 [Acetobacter aceti]|nr:hypothetical protein [Acetobacter aceti]
MRDEHLAVPFCLSDSLCVHDSNLFAEPIGVTSLIGDYRARSLAL